MKYLTNSGLSYFLNKIKAYIASQLNSKASAIHTHTKSDIIDLPNGYVVDSTLDGTSSNAIANSTVKNALDGKSDVGHTHTKSEITDFPTLATVATSGSYNDLSNKPVTMTPTSHTHGNITNDGKIGSNANKPLITTTGGTVTTGSFGTSANTFCEGNDSRLSDARAPTAHTHSASDITSGLATVATSGSYTDLSNKPTIPSNTNQLTNGAGYITSSGSCNYATTAGAVSTSVAEGSTKDLIFANMTGWDSCWIRFGGASDAGYLEIATADNANEPIYVRQYYLEGGNARTLTLLDEFGNTQFPGTVSAPTFSGNLNGNCSGSCNYADSAGSVAWGNVSGRPTALSQFTNDSGFLTSADRLPIGSYIQFAGSQAPEGFLVCNGGEISRTTYSALFAVIGTTYGSGDGSTTFNLPNLIDRFLQGSTTSGTVKNAGLPNITGYFNPYGEMYWGDTVGPFYWISSNQPGWGTSTGMDNDNALIGFDASRSSSIYGNSATVQPPALTCLICIKY